MSGTNGTASSELGLKRKVESTSSTYSKKKTKVSSNKHMDMCIMNSKKLVVVLERLERDDNLEFSKRVREDDVGTIMFDYKNTSTSIPLTGIRRMMTSFGPDFSLWDSQMKDALESQHGAINEFADNLDSFVDYLELGLELATKAGLDDAKVDIKEPIIDEITDEETDIKQKTFEDTQVSGEETVAESASLDTESDSAGEH
jgi:hypothetical protein